jgi:hypothetical protein
LVVEFAGYPDQISESIITEAVKKVMEAMEGY